jgi:hypothetical protein
MRRFQPGEVVRHELLGKGTIVQLLDSAGGIYYVLWDEDPPYDYNTCVNPSVVLVQSLKREKPDADQG